jgi:hypothetical protein
LPAGYHIDTEWIDAGRIPIVTHDRVRYGKP